MKANFDPVLHSFRGLSILLIVALHGFSFMIFYAGHESPKIYTDWIDNINEILLHDGTIFFALISGILFSYVLVARGWANFFKSKLLNVVIPYIFFSCLFTYFHWNLNGEMKVFSGSLTEFLSALFVNLYKGDAIFTFWYIPVLLVLYISTPLLYTLMQNKFSRWLLVPIVLMPLIASRHWPEITWTNYAYFIGVYAMGLYAGSNYPDIVDKLNKHVMALGIFTVITTAILVVFFYYEIKQWEFISLRETAWYVQKLAMAGLAFVFINRHVSKVTKFFNLLGTYAFPIYFMHGYLMFQSYELYLKFGLQISNYALLSIVCLFELVAALLICVLISMLVQKILGRWSRQIIGA